MSRETTFLAVTPSMRLRVETTIENLLLLLDEIEGDENLEEGDDTEPNGDELDYSGDEMEYGAGDDEMAPLDESDPCARPAARQVLPRLREITASV